jgi:transcriptional regulator with XRE-family HTH domain/predicted ATP-dependent protease
MSSISPERVRELRGGASRAAFARRLGVTPNTVYRWELPETAAEARRPRGAALEKLSRLQAAPAAEESARRALPVSDTPNDDLAQALLGVERVLRGEPRRGQNELVQLLATARGLSADARALSAFGIALAEIVLTGDPKSALVAISPALADAEQGTLVPHVAARVFAVAALVRSLPAAALFDHGHVQACAARAEALLGGTDPETSALGILASLAAAMMMGDRDLLELGYARLDQVPLSSLRVLVALHVEEFQGLRPMVAGKATATTPGFEAISDKAREAGYPILAARALAHQAQSDLDNLADPEQVLVLIRRGRQLVQPRTASGVHDVLLARAEAEAELRSGHPERALAALGALQSWSAETGLPPLSAIPTWARVLLLTGGADAFAVLSVPLRECDVPALKSICRACLLFVEALETLHVAADPASVAAAFERAEAEARRWPFLLRSLMLHGVVALVATGQEGSARLALRRAQRLMDSFPAPWTTAVLRRVEGTLLAANGHWREGRNLLESAVATFELAKDRCDAALVRYLIAAFSFAYDEPGARELLDEQRVAVEAVGIKPPKSMGAGLERLRRKRAQEPTGQLATAGASIESLVVPLQRLSVRGALPSLILRELLSIVEQLFPNRGVRLDELDSSGAPRELLGASAASPATAVELGDGAGRIFRLGVGGEVGEAGRALLSVLATVASLSLEAATLRGYDERRAGVPADERAPEIPGFLAASPAMRRLRSELMRLVGSSATVIITGESGVGKEVVARAIHELSERASQPYVAFNCATVPRELFEGQLFGYRRGAFTGASSDHAGVIRAAAGGTLFLDEIGELPLDIQPKLLRFLENGEVFPLGERRPLRVDVRTLAATHRNLGELVQAGKFREDLYYRLQVVPIHVPPLRERREDIALLARHFLREQTRFGEPPVLGPDALSRLSAHHWPGNVRELRNVIERALAFSPTPSVLRAEHMRLDGLSA